MQKLGVKAPPVRIDSQAKYGALSRGDGAIYLRFPNKGYREKIWDHAAGYIVIAGTFHFLLPRKKNVYFKLDGSYKALSLLFSGQQSKSPQGHTSDQK